MKLSSNLLTSIALGISVGTLIVSCEETNVNSSTSNQEKPKKNSSIKPVSEKENTPNPYVNGSCPNCGKG